MQVNRLVRYQTPRAITNNCKTHQNPPILREQFDVRPQIFKAYEGCLWILCHLAQKYASMRTLALIFLFLFATQASMSGQVDDEDNTCCDSDSAENIGGFLCIIAGNNGNYNDQVDDGIVGDCDCSDVDQSLECVPIPLDGGLSLLALAGGGLATAAMRRRRREEGQRAEQTLN